MSGPATNGPQDRAGRRRATCQGQPAELFFPPERAEGRSPVPWSPEPAQAGCRRCPVAEAWVAWALATGQGDGVWAAMAEEELRRLQRRPRRRAS